MSRPTIIRPDGKIVRLKRMIDRQVVMVGRGGAFRILMHENAAPQNSRIQKYGGAACAVLPQKTCWLNK